MQLKSTWDTIKCFHSNIAGSPCTFFSEATHGFTYASNYCSGPKKKKKLSGTFSRNSFLLRKVSQNRKYIFQKCSGVEIPNYTSHKLFTENCGSYMLSEQTSALSQLASDITLLSDKCRGGNMEDNMRCKACHYTRRP